MNNIISLFSNQVFQTVLSGVLVFILGQVLIRFVIEPIQELKKTIGKISYELKFYANVYTSANIAPETFWEVSKVLRKLASELEANYNAIPIKDIFSFTRVIPCFVQFSKASENLIRLSNGAGDKEFPVKNAEAADKIRSALGIKTLSD